MPGLSLASRRLAPFCLVLCLVLSACDSGTEAPGTPMPPGMPDMPGMPDVPDVPTPPAAFSISVVVRDASGAPVAGLPVELQFFPSGALAVAGSLAARRSVAVFDLSPVSPTPFQGAARVESRQDVSLFARVDLVDVSGSRRRFVFEGPIAAGSTSFVFPGRDDDEQRLPGGIYAVRMVAGGDSLLRYTITTDTGFEEEDNLEGTVGRSLGTTDAAGRVSTRDRTAAPGLFVRGVEILLTDEVGNSLGAVTVGERLAVVVRDLEGRSLARSVITARDDLNAVELRVP